MFDIINGNLQEVVDRLRPLEQVPAQVQDTLYATLRTRDHCLAALRALEQEAEQLSAVRADLAKLSAGQEEFRDLQFRGNRTLLDILEEQRQIKEDQRQQNECLKRIEEALRALHAGDPDRAEAIFARESAAQPASAALAVAEAAAQVAGHDFVGAAKALRRRRVCVRATRNSTR